MGIFDFLVIIAVLAVFALGMVIAYAFLTRKDRP
jgi:hypothetical protein